MNDLLKTATDAALRAGDAILQIYARDFEVELKADESPLTEADKAAHAIICDALEGLGLPVLSEESREIPYAERKDWQKYWLVDPLDGTKEFIKKNGEFTVNIALIENGRPVMGVVFAPVLKTLYMGVVGQGAFRAIGDDLFQTLEKWDGKIPGIGEFSEALPLSSDLRPPSSDLCPPSSDLCPPSSVLRPPSSDLRRPSSDLRRPSSVLRVVASRSHCNDATRAFIAELEEEGPVEMVSSGSSLKLCLVAEGSADIYPRIAPTMEWDTAAAQAVVEASGGRVVRYDPSISAAACIGGMLDVEALSCNKADLLNPHFVVFREKRSTNENV